MFTRTSMFRTKSRSSVESSDICKSHLDCMQEWPLQGCSTWQIQTSVVVFGLCTGTHSHSHHASSYPDKPGMGQGSKTNIHLTIPDAEEASRQLIAGLMDSDRWTVGGSLTEKALPPQGIPTLEPFGCEVAVLTEPRLHCCPPKLLPASISRTKNNTSVGPQTYLHIFSLNRGLFKPVKVTKWLME